jgi:hypothetical protein
LNASPYIISILEEGDKKGQARGTFGEKKNARFCWVNLKGKTSLEDTRVDGRFTL